MPIDLVKKIKNLFKDRKLAVLWIVGAVVLVIVAVIAIVSSFRKEPETPDNTNYLIETPMQYDGGHSVYFPPAVTVGKEFPKSLEVFDINEVNQSSTIDKFLLKVGKTGTEKDTIGTSLYSWTKEGTYVEYIPFQQKLKFKLTDPFKISLTTQFADDEAVNNFFEQFMKEYFSKEFNYTDGKISTSGKNTRIEVNRYINGYPLYLQNHNTYTDYLVVDNNGNVYEGELAMVEFSESSSESIRLVHYSNLQELLATDTYPKDIFEGYSEELSKILIDSGDIPDGADQITQLPHPTISQAKDIKLGYYYSSDSFKQIVPIYRIEAVGTIVYLGKNASIPLLIYANALDPERVYIPNE